MEGTLNREDSEPQETLTEHSKRVFDEVEANQPEKAEVLMSEGMAEAAAEITEKYQKTLEHA